MTQEPQTPDSTITLLLLQQTYADHLKLEDKGALSSLKTRNSKLAALNSKADLGRLHGQLKAIDSEIVKIGLAIEYSKPAERANWSDQLVRATKRHSIVIAERATLEQEVAQGVMRAPAAGTLSEWHMSTTGMVLARGQDAGMLTSLTEDFVVQLRVPAKFVDQVRVGQTGTLVFNSLPERNMPKVEIVVEEIASAAVPDSEGLALYYRASAQIAKQDIMLAKQLLGERFQLSVDMPVTANLVGPSTTAMAFFLSPIAALFRDGFEAG
jgi:hypothetical protein